MKTLRSAMPRDAWQEQSERIVQNIKALEKFHAAKVIHAFISDENRQEVNLIPLLEWIVSNQKKLLAPVIEGRELISVELTSLEHLTRQAFGVLEPTEREPSALESEIDLALVPLLAVDKKGNRLGYGKGYYDRFFKRLNKRIFKLGVAFDFQIVDSVPATRDDVRIDAVITQFGLTACND